MGGQWEGKPRLFQAVKLPNGEIRFVECNEFQDIDNIQKEKVGKAFTVTHGNQKRA